MAIAEHRHIKSSEIVNFIEPGSHPSFQMDRYNTQDATTANNVLKMSTGMSLSLFLTD
jgi:hypothetical protein